MSEKIEQSGYTIAPSGCTTGTGGTATVTYIVSATPQSPGQTGIRYFCSDQSGVIRYDPSAACDTTSSKPLQ